MLVNMYIKFHLKILNCFRVLSPDWQMHGYLPSWYRILACHGRHEITSCTNLIFFWSNASFCYEQKFLGTFILTILPSPLPISRSVPVLPRNAFITLYTWFVVAGTNGKHTRLNAGATNGTVSEYTPTTKALDTPATTRPCVVHGRFFWAGSKKISFN